MGAVYQGTDRRDGTLVAIKILHAQLGADPAFRERFEREAHVASLLRSPYTVRILDYGESNQSLFIAMEYVDGPSLASLLSSGALPLREAVGIARHVALALEEAETRGIVHRDIKPENILLYGPNSAKLADFGIARSHSSVTIQGGFYGTPLYAAPEQFHGRADKRSDIYSLGATLYHFVTGLRPVPADSGQNQLELEEGRAALGRLPADLVRLIDRAMAREPDDRFQSAAEILDALGSLDASILDQPLAIGVENAAERRVSGPDQMTTPLMHEAITLRVLRASAGFPLTRRLATTRYEVTVSNESREAVQLKLSVDDRSRRCSFSHPESVVVEPRSTSRFALKVKPKRRRWRGPSVARVFTLFASRGNGAPPLSTSGRYDDMSWGWVPAAAAVLFAAPLAAVLAVLLLGAGANRDAGQGNIAALPTSVTSVPTPTELVVAQATIPPEGTTCNSRLPPDAKAFDLPATEPERSLITRLNCGNASFDSAMLLGMASLLGSSFTGAELTTLEQSVAQRAAGGSYKIDVPKQLVVKKIELTGGGAATVQTQETWETQLYSPSDERLGTVQCNFGQSYTLQLVESAWLIDSVQSSSDC